MCNVAQWGIILNSNSSTLHIYIATAPFKAPLMNLVTVTGTGRKGNRPFLRELKNTPRYDGVVAAH